MVFLIYRNTLRVTKSSQLDSVDEKGKTSTYLGKEGVDFDFSTLPLNVEFIETSVNKDTDNLVNFEKVLIKIS